MRYNSYILSRGHNISEILLTVVLNTKTHLHPQEDTSFVYMYILKNQKMLLVEETACKKSQTLNLISILECLILSLKTSLYAQC